MKNKIIKENILVSGIFAFIMVILCNIKWGNCDYLFTVIVPFLLILLGYIYLLRNKDSKNNKAYLLLIPIVLIFINSIMFNSNEMDFSNRLLNILILPILISMFLLIYTNKNYKINGNFWNWIFKLFPVGLFSNLKFLKLEKDKDRVNKITNIILGIIVGGSIGLIILRLLMSADDYFSAFIDNFANIFNFKFGNVIVFIISFIVCFSGFINVLQSQSDKLNSIKTNNPDKTMITTILSIVNVVFVLFLISEVSRLTNNFLQLPVSYTYSSYAREGFFQLLFVTLINFIIIMFLLYKTKLIKDNKTIRILNIILIIFSLLLICNSYYRMGLYIGHFGLTILRLQVILFLAMEVILFGILLKRILKGLRYRDGLLFFIIMISFYIINLYMCNDVIIRLLNRI